MRPSSLGARSAPDTIGWHRGWAEICEVWNLRAVKPLLIGYGTPPDTSVGALRSPDESSGGTLSSADDRRPSPGWTTGRRHGNPRPMDTDAPTAPRPAEIEALFTRADGQYLCARWGRPLVPVVFGVDDATISMLKGAVEALCVLTGHRMAETDPELGANLMVFFLRDWSELTEAPNLDRLIPELGPLVTRLKAVEANQYRIFRFEADGAIRACFSFIRMDVHLAGVPAETLALNQMVQAMLLWSDRAFTDTSPLAIANGIAMLRPDIAEVMRAAYDPVLPAMTRDPAHAMRLAARVGRVQ